uniref:Uncharacterized protein n=1 Tax=Avena sativa TaxID=4498 RepID=A0ACD5XKB7_AVESA
MSSTNDGGINGAGGGGTMIPAPRPHWRRRDPAATVVYVVHPAQFRNVVQQLTGAAPTKTAPQARRYAAGPGTSADANAAALEQRCHDGEVDRGGTGGDSTRATTTLRQMMEECIAWATDDGCGGNDEDRGEAG